MPLTDRTKQEMVEGQQELRRKNGLPPLSPVEAEAWLMMFLAQDERLQRLQEWIAAGVVHMIIAGGTRLYGAAPGAIYVVQGETFVDEDPLLFPSPEFMARLILAVEFAPKVGPFVNVKRR